MSKRNRLIAIVVAAVAAASLLIAYMAGNFLTQSTPTSAFISVMDLSAAPFDVQEAAAKLRSSRVGYAMVKADKTYLIISTGNDAQKVKVDRAEGQPDLVNPSFVDVHLNSDAAGGRLLIATTKLTTPTEYQFDVDGSFAAIPTLHNRHNLPLIPLNAVNRFSLVTPLADQMVQGGTLHMEGYAQVFEAAFTVTVTTAKGRVIGYAPVQSAAGAPSWGSFVADVPYDASSATETGFVILEEGMTGAKLVIPVRFRTPQMG